MLAPVGPAKSGGFLFIVWTSAVPPVLEYLLDKEAGLELIPQ